MQDPDTDYEYEQTAPNKWRCESCGHNFTRPWPKDRQAYYANPKPGKCPSCKTKDSVPVGY